MLRDEEERDVKDDVSGIYIVVAVGNDDNGSNVRVSLHWRRIRRRVSSAHVPRLPGKAHATVLVVVVVTQHELSFDHLRVVDDCQFKFDRAFAKLDAGLQTLPVVSVGHSMGAHVHALINSRYELNREALVLISYNNKPATAAVPLFAEVFVPGLSAISPVLQPLAASPLRESLRTSI